MKSRTKYNTDSQTIEKLFDSAGIRGAWDISPLGAGEYNAVFSAKAGGREYAIKISPKSDTAVLTYEKNIMASEVYWYEKIREHTSITVPKIYHAGFDESIIPAKFIIMEKFAGQQPGKMEISDAEKDQKISEMAKMAAQIHKVKNDKFGYIQNTLYDDWYHAIRSMAVSILNDCAVKRRKSKRGETLIKYVDKYKTVLEKAECCMVNFDLWPSNILCSRENEEVTYAWIDPERGFWGDRIADFVCLEVMTPLEDKTRSLSAYNSAADKPVVVTEEEKIRYAVALGYLGLIMEAEKYFRYTPLYYGWWRNVFASKMFFKKAFDVLENA